MRTHICALDIGGTKIAAAHAIVDVDKHGHMSCELYGERKRPTEAKLGGTHVLATVIELVSELAAEADRDDPITEVAISSAGVVNPVTGDITYANDLMPGWGGTKLAEEVTFACGLDCHVLNDVHAHALGELRFGAGQGKKDALVVALGTGMGGAYITGGKLVVGAGFEAGHIGHMSSKEAGNKPCSCGARGHVETVAAGPGIIAYYKELADAAGETYDDDIDGQTISELAEDGDEYAITAETRSADATGEVIGSLVNMLNPELVILSGSVVKAGPIWHNALKEAFAAQVMPPVADTPLVVGSLGGAAALMGAASHAVVSALA